MKNRYYKSRERGVDLTILEKCHRYKVSQNNSHINDKNTDAQMLHHTPLLLYKNTTDYMKCSEELHTSIKKPTCHQNETLQLQ
jgi:hypothetical protein